MKSATKEGLFNGNIFEVLTLACAKPFAKKKRNICMKAVFSMTMYSIIEVKKQKICRLLYILRRKRNAGYMKYTT